MVPQGAVDHPKLRFIVAENTLMTLIASISGIRGVFGAGLDASVLVRYALAYGQWALERTRHLPPRIVVGRDARVSGEVCAQIVIGTLRSLGLDVVDAGLAATPTVAMAVLHTRARGGIVLSASHNPEEWNALKLLNEKSEFLSSAEGAAVMSAAGASPDLHGDRIGAVRAQDFLEHHVKAITALDFHDAAAIRACRFRVVVDGINSVGALALPKLLTHIGVRQNDIKVLNGELTGRFAHPAEPLPEHLAGTMAQVREGDFALGLVVDPDADRLALIDECGGYVSEELTQVMAADFLWRKRSGPFATNLSSSRAIDDVAARYGQRVYRSAVGEINVVKKMQEVGAILGGEGNGGVILPDLHYGRDALVGAAMVLQHLAEQQCTLSDLMRAMPQYVMSKEKVRLKDPDTALARIASQHTDEELNTVDGVRLSFAHGWVHLRKSNTEPVVRVYAEASTQAESSALAADYMDRLQG